MEIARGVNSRHTDSYGFGGGGSRSARFFEFAYDLNKLKRPIGEIREKAGVQLQSRYSGHHRPGSKGRGKPGTQQAGGAAHSRCIPCRVNALVLCRVLGSRDSLEGSDSVRGFDRVDGGTVRQTRVALAEAQITRAESFERGTIGADNVRVQRVGSSHQPRVVLAQSARCAGLNQSAPSCVSEVQTLD